MALLGGSRLGLGFRLDSWSIKLNMNWKPELCTYKASHYNLVTAAIQTQVRVSLIKGRAGLLIGSSVQV